MYATLRFKSLQVTKFYEIRCGESWMELEDSYVFQLYVYLIEKQKKIENFFNTISTQEFIQKFRDIANTDTSKLQYSFVM